MSTSDRSAILAVALTLAPVALAAWVTKSRGVFVAGAIGAVIGLLASAIGHTIGLTVFDTLHEWSPDATERNLIITFTSDGLMATLPGAAAGVLVGWRIWCRN